MYRTLNAEAHSLIFFASCIMHVQSAFQLMNVRKGAVSRRTRVSGTSSQFGYRNMVKNLVASLFTHSLE